MSALLLVVVPPFRKQLEFHSSAFLIEFHFLLPPITKRKEAT